MADDRQFVHLHVHTEYSVLDGAAKVKEAIDRVAEMGSPAMAITDHGTMGGIAEAYFHAKKRGIKLIPGLEAYHVEDMRSEENLKRYHTLLLATSNEGYRNLMHLSGKAWREGAKGKFPRIDDELLAEHSEGLVMTSGCLSGMVNRALLEGDYAKARSIAERHRDIMGPGRYFIEVQNHGIDDQLSILDDQVRLAKDIGVGLLATNDSHYVREDQHDAHDHMLCAQVAAQISDPNRFKFDGEGHHIKTPAEMWELFPEEEFPGACANTLEIADMVDFTMETGKYLIPKFPLPEGVTSEQGLRESALEGVKRKYANRDGVVEQKVMDRLEYELDVINTMGFNDYMLILSDAVKFCKRQGIGVGPGRGSGAGSLVVYCIDITDVDPIKEGLFFERFLNPDRDSMPDIDMDIQSERRGELHVYLMEKYGADRVAQISTYGVLKPKSAIKSAARVLGRTVAEGESLSAMVPDAGQGGYCTITHAMGPDSGLPRDDEGNVNADVLKSWQNMAGLRRAYKKDRGVREVVDVAMNIEGYISHRGIHPGGFVVTPTAVNDYFPTRTDDSINIIEFEYGLTEKLGGLKIDFLGLKNVSSMAAVLRHIETDLNQRIDLSRIPMDDPGAFKMLSSGDLFGMFQFDTSAGHKMLDRLKPKRFDDIVAASALNRPGPMESNSHVRFADRRNKREAIEVAHPDLRTILNDTAGILTYQEQVMQIGQHYAGFSGAEADHLRKAMGKKVPEEMAAMKAKFLDGVEENGYERKLGQTLWDEIEPFAGYAFNKSHATAYSTITYWLAYLKAHFRPQFHAGHMDTLGGDKYYACIINAREAGVNIYGPNINRSSDLTSTNDTSIWMGLSGIKNVNYAAVRDILNERKRGGAFASVQDFFIRTNHSSAVRAKAITALASAGAFDVFEVSRKKVVDNVDALLSDAKRMAMAEENDLGVDLFDLGDDVESALDSYDLQGEDYTKRERQALEDEYLGFIVGDHPYADMVKMVPAAVERGVIPGDAMGPAEFLDSNPAGGTNASIYGIITSIATKSTKKGNPFTTFNIESADYSRVDCRVWGRELPPSMAGAFVLATGRVQYNSVSKQDDEETLEMIVNSLDVLKDEDMTGERKTRGGLGVIDSRRPRRSRSASTPASPATPEPQHGEEAPFAVLYTIDRGTEGDLAEYLKGVAGNDRPENLALFRYPDSQDAELAHPGPIAMSRSQAQGYGKALDIKIVER